jgi:hypothetical protein
MAQRHHIDFGNRPIKIELVDELIEDAVNRKVEQMNRDRTLNGPDLDKTGWQMMFAITAATILTLIASGSIWAILWLWTHLPVS